MVQRARVGVHDGLRREGRVRAPMTNQPAQPAVSPLHRRMLEDMDGPLSATLRPSSATQPIKRPPAINSSVSAPRFFFTGNLPIQINFAPRQG